MIIIAIATTEMIARNAHWNYIRSGKFLRQNPGMVTGRRAVCQSDKR